MLKKRPLSSWLVGLVLLSLAQGAAAIGWLRAQQTAVLGQPLDFTASLRLDPGDTLASECVAADVMVGEQRLPSAGVRVQVDASNPEVLVMRVRTLSNVDEPVVAVTLGIGCPARMSRRFVLLADPPGMAAPLPLVAAPPLVPAAETAAAPPVAEPAARAATAAPAAAPAAATAPRPRSEPRARSDAEPRRTPRPARPAAPQPVPRDVAAPVARLKLDAVDPVPRPSAAAASAVAEAIEAVSLAASAARAAASAASAADERIAALERSVAQMRSDAAANRELVAQLRGRVAEAEAANRWTTPLALAVAALLALALWLAWRLRALQEERQRAWRRATSDASPPRPATPTSQLPMVTSEIMPAPAPAAASSWVGTPTPASAPAWPAAAPRPAPRPPPPLPPPEPPMSPMERTAVLPPRAVPADDGAARDVSIEELLDLEQQAEFFIVLGQDDAAVELLVDHLRNTGGGSPLPYLKLLEVYRRRGERDAYERTRARFNHRFNAYAPDWDNDLQQGLSLEDYPGVIPRLQQVWPRPLDAMAELEALLFRKSRGELFELPAYREVLFLYSLARDLLDREAVDSGHVDLLLPLADGGEFSSTSPHPYFGMEHESVFDPLAAEDRPTAPVDLDLTQPETPPVIVDPKSPPG